MIPIPNFCSRKISSAMKKFTKSIPFRFGNFFPTPIDLNRIFFPGPVRNGSQKNKRPRTFSLLPSHPLPRNTYGIPRQPRANPQLYSASRILCVREPGFVVARIVSRVTGEWRRDERRLHSVSGDAERYMRIPLAGRREKPGGHTRSDSAGQPGGEPPPPPHPPGELRSTPAPALKAPWGQMLTALCQGLSGLPPKPAEKPDKKQTDARNDGTERRRMSWF